MQIYMAKKTFHWEFLESLKFGKFGQKHHSLRLSGFYKNFRMINLKKMHFKVGFWEFSRKNILNAKLGAWIGIKSKEYIKMYFTDSK